MHSRLLVAAQLAAIAAIVLPWSALAFHREGFVPLALGALVGAWTLTANRPGNFSVFPEPRAKAQLVTSGPYRFVRHPMYLAVLLLALGCAVGWRTWIHAIAFVVLAIVLHRKADLEERFLLAQFPDYRGYLERTPRILPFVR